MNESRFSVLELVTQSVILAAVTVGWCWALIPGVGGLRDMYDRIWTLIYSVEDLEED